MGGYKPLVGVKALKATQNAKALCCVVCCVVLCCPVLYCVLSRGILVLCCILYCAVVLCCVVTPSMHGSEALESCMIIEIG